MWVRGAGNFFPQYREGGIVEEPAMENIYNNPQMNFSLWDAVLYNKAIAEPNLTLLLNATCIGATEKNKRIESVRVWQLTTYTKFCIHARYFADCSGDCILADFTFASTRRGREGRDEFHESLAPEQADRCTMGNSVV